MKQLEKALRRPITGILISIVMGFIVGAIVLSIAGYNPAAAYASMISGIFSNPTYIVQVIIRATPLIFTGLSILRPVCSISALRARPSWAWWQQSWSATASSSRR